MNKIQISPITIEDIPAIASLQSELLLKNTKNAEKGFLVSGYSNKEYEKFLACYDFFFKACINDKIVGCLMAFNSENILPDDETNLMLKFTAKKEFVLIKQVFVSRNYAKSGIAALLYQHLATLIKKDRAMLAVIVSEPLNVASCKFHKKMGFTEYLHFTPKADKDGKIRKRSTWIHLPNKDSLISDYVKLSNRKMDDQGEMLIARSTQMTDLYTHEDNLNWTKLGMQITLLFALMAAFGFFYQRSITKSAFPVLLPLAMWGGIINYVFYLKIKSGIEFMTKHKNNIIQLDKEIRFYYPEVNPLFPDGSKITQKSKTVKMLPNISLFGLLIWAVVSLLLLLKAIGIFSAV
ncbi:hypothetical protein BZG02_13830 [Labilibaculum filiforme]|uniref:N-acetyltransferase domain-containing protein n=1 Tax=Labilibaculum filiforme TaxID=1940526 RepID=A0A2N3HVB6_9BACT|nr:GNAT family N-acetyltransferase [Labilibaculum filiforme]PKQ62015.1 hypothetical protein BZG02_13830 [Labilibaculum filiforme]